jgi:diketogulonate reductase-like aldo/keto reductase
MQAYCPLVRGNEKLSHPVLVALAEKHERSPAQVLLRWSLQKGYAHFSASCIIGIADKANRFVPLPKSVTPERIIANTKLYDFQLDKEDMDKLDALDMGKDGAISWNPVNAP